MLLDLVLLYSLLAHSTFILQLASIKVGRDPFGSNLYCTCTVSMRKTDYIIIQNWNL